MTGKDSLCWQTLLFVWNMWFPEWPFLRLPYTHGLFPHAKFYSHTEGLSGTYRVFKLYNNAAGLLVFTTQKLTWSKGTIVVSIGSCCSYSIHSVLFFWRDCTISLVNFDNHVFVIVKSSNTILCYFFKLSIIDLFWSGLNWTQMLSVPTGREKCTPYYRNRRNMFLL